MRRLGRLENLQDIKPFDCGDNDLNGFLVDDAKFYYKELIANTFVMEDETEIVAYFSLLNDKISQTTVSKNLWRKLRKTMPHRKHLGSYPAMKIGRLAISKNHQCEGIGTKLVSAIKQMTVNSQTAISACRFLTVDAYKEALPFYERNGFKRLVNEDEEGEYTIPMYYDLKELKEF